MSVSGVSTTNQAYPSASSPYLAQLQQDLQNLGSSLQGGDLSGAQADFAQMLQDLQNPVQGANTAQGTTASGGTAQAQWHHHHHRHHHGLGVNAAQGSSSQSASTQAASGTAPSSTQLAQNLLAIPASGILPAVAALTADGSSV